MDRIVEKISFPKLQKTPLLKVAAYARVSSGKDAMLHSLSAQVSYYSNYIQNNRGWQYAGVYSDEAVTGTKDNREGFQKLLADCKNGKIDLIITKSISRFARNTVTLLETVREFKNLGVDVYFEEQNIHTLSADGELMLTILASYAQEESLSASENQKWRVKRNFEEGKPWNGTIFGYRYIDGQYVIMPNEAQTVKMIYNDYLSGMGVEAVMKKLNKQGILSRHGKKWCNISNILRNEIYTGNLTLQKTIRENHLTKQKIINKGKLPLYRVENSHNAIIDQKTFDAVQNEIEIRSIKNKHKGKPRAKYPFTSIITCGICGKHYRRKVTASRPVWICSNYNIFGKAACPSKQIPEETLYSIILEVLKTDVFDNILFNEKISCISAMPNNIIVFKFLDGSEIKKHWKDRSRSISWTEEMKEKARQKGRKI